MIVGIAGLGCVGSAILKSFEMNNIETRVYDKYKNIGNISNLLNSDMIFLCLPTEFNFEKLEYDKSCIYDVCQQLKDYNYMGIVMIKSTVEPTTSHMLASSYGLNIVHNPEFLSAKTAFEDYHHQNHIVIGCTNKIQDFQLDLIKSFYSKYYGNAQISICDSNESESMKLFCNSFYAVKLQFFNELYLLCHNHNINFDLVKNLMLKNNWINPMHTQVPGTDGKLSYGGMCFPKDTNALNAFMNKSGTPHKVIEAVINERNLMRNIDI